MFHNFLSPEIEGMKELRKISSGYDALMEAVEVGSSNVQQCKVYNANGDYCSTFVENCRLILKYYLFLKNLYNFENA